MPPTEDEQTRLDRLDALTAAAIADRETEPTFGPTFIARLVRGLINLRDRVDALRDRLTTLDAPAPATHTDPPEGRVTILERQVFRARVVDALPSQAIEGALLKIRGDDAFIYVGTGAGNALRKIPTQPLT